MAPGEPSGSDPIGEMVTQQAEFDVLASFARDVRDRFGDWVEDLVLFGSRARGTAAPWSDWDILAVTTGRDREKEEALIDLAVGYLLSDRINLSVKFMTRDLRNLQLRIGAPFMQNVSREGKSLWTTTGSSSGPS